MAKWYIVKINWKTIDEEYLGVGGDYWPDIQYMSNLDLCSDKLIQSQGKMLLNKVENSCEYVELSGVAHHVVTDYTIAKEYYLFLDKLNTSPIFVSVSDDLQDTDTDGYDYGHPAGGYSIIESVILSQNNEELRRKYLNKHLLFGGLDAMSDFLDFISTRNDVETLDFYQAVSIKQLTA